MAQQASDWQEIYDLCVRYTTALDTRDFDLLKSTFTPDGTADFGALAGFLESPEKLAELCQSALRDLEATQHLLGNFVIEVNGDEATQTHYFQANHFLSNAPGGNNFVVWGTYKDKLVRTPQGWKIKHRDLIPTATGGNQNLFAEAAEMHGRTYVGAQES